MKKLLVVILFSAAMAGSLFSQVSFSAGPTIGVTIPSGDYSGTTIDYYNGVKYGLGTGINFGVVFKAKSLGIDICPFQGKVSFPPGCNQPKRMRLSFGALFQGMAA